MTTPYNPPLRASHYCRHYSYERGETLLDGGPKCAVGCDLSRSVMQCMPAAIRSARPLCDHRQEYTDEERAASEAYTKEATGRTIAALGALNEVFDANGSGKIECPNCGAGLSWWRKGKHAQFACETQHCCGGFLTLSEHK